MLLTRFSRIVSLLARWPSIKRSMNKLLSEKLRIYACFELGKLPCLCSQVVLLYQSPFCRKWLFWWEWDIIFLGSIVFPSIRSSWWREVTKLKSCGELVTEFLFSFLHFRPCSCSFRLKINICTVSPFYDTDNTDLYFGVLSKAVTFV